MRQPTHTRAAVVGSGFAGIGASIVLSRAGVDHVVLERADDLGFDFVSASDHPCGTHPTYETWTMLSCPRPMAMCASSTSMSRNCGSA